MDQFVEKDFGKIIKKNAQSQRHDLLPLGTDCFRIYDRNLSDFPVTVDIYDKYARVVDYGEEPLSDFVKEKCFDLITRMAYVDSDKIVYSYRSKRDFHQQHEKTDNDALIVNVKENNLLFKTDLTSYTDTGLFLDHMLTRLLIKERSASCDVLNLFSYTGSFSVYAASGLAKTVTSVDLSQTYTKWAEENLANNGFSGENYKCICADALKFLEEEKLSNRKYDIVIFDPPSFSNSHKMEKDFDVQRDFVEFIKKICAVLRPTGFILFSTNLGSFKIDKKYLKGLGIKEISDQVRAPGFVKDRKGTVRSWIMAIDDTSLTLDWSEDKKPSRNFREGRERKDGPRYEERRKRDFGDSKNYKDRPRREYSDRKDDFRPKRRFDDDRPRGHRDSYHSDRFHHDDERFPKREYSEKRSYSDRSERDSYKRDERPSFRRYDDEKRSFSHDRDRQSRYDKPSFSDRKRDPRDSSRPSFRREENYHSEYKSTERRSSRRDKPYGYDSFKPARSRNDSSDFFWNDEDINK